MFSFLFLVIRFQIVIVDFTVSVKHIRNSASHTFFKKYVNVKTGISSITTFVILNFASELKPGALK